MTEQQARERFKDWILEHGGDDGPMFLWLMATGEVPGLGTFYGGDREDYFSPVGECTLGESPHPIYPYPGGLGFSYIHNQIIHHCADVPLVRERIAKIVEKYRVAQELHP